MHLKTPRPLNGLVGYFHTVVYRRRAEQGDERAVGSEKRAVESRGCLLAAQGCSTWNIQRIQVCYSERGGWLEWDCRYGRD